MKDSEIRDQLRAFLHRMLHERGGTFDEAVKQLTPLGLSFPLDQWLKTAPSETEVDRLRIVIARLMTEVDYIEQAIIDARTLGLPVTDPNPALTEIREAVAECARYRGLDEAKFSRSDLQIGKAYRLKNGDVFRIDAVDYYAGITVRGYNVTFKHPWSWDLDRLQSFLYRKVPGDLPTIVELEDA